MATALDFTKAKSQLISILQASRTAYGSTVDGSKRQFNSDTEIADALLYADGEVCTDICQTPGHPFSGSFKLTSSALQYGAALPNHVGRVLRVTHSATSNGTYTAAIKAKSREEVDEMINYASTYGTASYTLDYYAIEDNMIYPVDAYSKVDYTDYVKTASPQAPESYASVVVYGAVVRLMKDGADDQMAAAYAQLYQQARDQIRQGAMMIPPVDQIK